MLLQALRLPGHVPPEAWRQDLHEEAEEAKNNFLLYRDRKDRRDILYYIMLYYMIIYDIIYDLLLHVNESCE